LAASVETKRAADSLDLSSFTFADAIGLAGFVIVWTGYALIIDHGPLAGRTLSASMDRQRRTWVEMMQTHDVRIADTNILAGLQQGTGFFASASMLAIGACLAVIGSGDALATVLEDLVPATTSGGALFEAKIVGLAIIFVYAFFKFSWAYRLINYASILIGGLPPAREAGTPLSRTSIDRATLFLRLGGRHFNRGQRAFFFAIAFLGWLAGPWVLLAGSLFVVAVLIHRQFWSLSARALYPPRD
jgi:uncharacterized membrane protein